MPVAPLGCWLLLEAAAAEVSAGLAPGAVLRQLGSAAVDKTMPLPLLPLLPLPLLQLMLLPLLPFLQFSSLLPLVQMFLLPLLPFLSLLLLLASNAAVPLLSLPLLPLLSLRESAAVVPLLPLGLAVLRCLCSRPSPSAVMKFVIMKLPGAEFTAAPCTCREGGGGSGH